MGSQYLNGLAPEQRQKLVKRLHAAQAGNCFICEKPIDLQLHADSIDVDHVEPLNAGGRDDESNFALTHSSCNRSKQASNLRVARVLAKFEDVRHHCEKDFGRGPNLSDVLQQFGGSRYPLSFSTSDGTVRYSLGESGDNSVHQVPLYHDGLSGVRYFFACLPIAYVFHDDRINPRSLGSSLGRLVEEFHKKRPQLHVALSWVNADAGPAEVKVFDGQHKAAAQVLLGEREIPVRIFVNPDPDTLVTTNFNAGTTLRQVAFDKSIQRRLGSTLFDDRLERYRSDRKLAEDDEGFSEEDLVRYFKGESREMKRYILDSVRDSITHDPNNRLKSYIDFGGKGIDKPLSYSTIEKTFYSFFIYQDLLSTPLDYRADEGLNPRDLEVEQVVRLMNLIADEIYVGSFDPDLGTYRIENRVQKGESIPEPHLRAFRMSKEEILYVWLKYIRQIVQGYFVYLGTPMDEARLFQYRFPEPLWDRLRAYLQSLKGLPVWANRDLSLSAFGGKQTYEYWQAIFETGRSPQGQQVLAGPIRLTDMIKT